MTLWWWQRQGSILLDFCSHLCQSACQPNRTLNGHYLLFRSFQLRVVLVAYELRGCGHFNMWAKRICSMRFAATGLLRKILWQNFPLLRKDSLRGAIGNLCHHSFSCIIACYTICLVFARGNTPLCNRIPFSVSTSPMRRQDSTQYFSPNADLFCLPHFFNLSNSALTSLGTFLQPLKCRNCQFLTPSLTMCVFPGKKTAHLSLFSPKRTIISSCIPRLEEQWTHRRPTFPTEILSRRHVRFVRVRRSKGVATNNSNWARIKQEKSERWSRSRG
mmetsp:Transcript_26226/g.77561  ORF Transcript_26226/g.77561 Transcript_26226/m.77561 type:complete len:274 (-) Transcript_26226:241-1062(-)